MKLISIIKETVIGDNSNQDKLFFDYCEEYSIEHKIIKEMLFDNLKSEQKPNESWRKQNPSPR